MGGRWLSSTGLTLGDTGLNDAESEARSPVFPSSMVLLALQETASAELSTLAFLGSSTEQISSVHPMCQSHDPIQAQLGENKVDWRIRLW